LSSLSSRGRGAPTSLPPARSTGHAGEAVTVTQNFSAASCAGGVIFGFMTSGRGLPRLFRPHAMLWAFGPYRRVGA
jgi:hypothetical protein